MATLITLLTDVAKLSGMNISEQPVRGALINAAHKIVVFASEYRIILLRKLCIYKTVQITLACWNRIFLSSERDLTKIIKTV